MKKSTVIRLIALLLSLLLLAGCGAGANNLMAGLKSGTQKAGTIRPADTAAVTDFAVRLMQASADGSGNLLISPLSVLAALAMTANGAKGETLAQMELVLGMKLGDLNPWLLAYRTALPAGEKYKLSMANSIWLRDDPSFAVNGDFLQTNADYYGADIFRAPFDEGTCREINSWVEENTDGMIKNILDRIGPDSVMFLINALAFDAEWQEIYEEYAIREGEFTAADGAKKTCELMWSDESLYLSDKDAEGFIKFYKDGKYAFAALLPKEGMALGDYLSSLTGERLNRILLEARNCPVDAAIPKFESESKVEMAELLTGMGMVDAFDSAKADLSGIGESTLGNLYISRVIHQTYINVDGKGTKAGAATVVDVCTEGCIEEPVTPKRVVLDRPFLYMLIDCEANLPFFIGVMTDPTAK